MGVPIGWVSSLDVPAQQLLGKHQIPITNWPSMAYIPPFFFFFSFFLSFLLILSFFFVVFFFSM